MAGFYSARSETIPPLPWPNFTPALTSVSDGGVVLSSAAQFPNHNTIHCLLTLPSAVVKPESTYTIGAFFEHRDAGRMTQGGVETPNLTYLLFQERIQFGGVWGSWTNLYNSGFSSGGQGAAYQQKFHVTNRIFNADSVQYRLLFGRETAGTFLWSQNCLRNASVSARAVRR